MWGMVRGLVTASVVGPLLAACGASGAIGGPPPPGATPVAVLTEADSGRTVRMAVGDRAVLHLGGAFTWSPPRSSGGAVRLGPAPGPTSGGEEVWTISAAAAGTATVTATGRPPCASGTICPQIVRAFTLTVVVT